MNKEPTKIDYLGDGISEVSLVDRMVQDFALKVTNAARASYNQEKKEFEPKDQKLTSFLWDKEHTSPFRHSYYTFQLSMPIIIARQLMKYQVGSGFRSVEAGGEEIFIEEFDHFYDIDKGCSWNEVSGRYTQTSDKFYIPKELRSNPGHGNKQSSGEYENLADPEDEDYLSPETIKVMMGWRCMDMLTQYHLYIKNGVAKEIARMFLPQGMYTKAYWTISLQSVIWFLHQRTKKDAQWEIQKFAEAVYTLVEPDLTKMGIAIDNL